LPLSSITKLCVNHSDFEYAVTTAAFFKSVRNSKLYKLELNSNRLGELRHAKLVANSLKGMRVCDLSLNNNDLTDSDLIVLLSKCEGTALRALDVRDNKKVRDARDQKALHELKPDGMAFSA
jgi:hypothetical protein